MPDTIRLSTADIRQLRTVAENIARDVSQAAGFAIEIAERINIFTGRTALNIWVISSVPDWDDTDIHTMHPWSRIREHHLLMEGKALLELHIRKLSRAGKSGKTVYRIQAELDEHGLVAIHANSQLNIWYRS